MKIKTFSQDWQENDEKFDSRMNRFIEDKQVVQITTNDTINTDNYYFHTLTILYK